jgi:hypothetical protein
MKRRSALLAQFLAGRRKAGMCTADSRLPQAKRQRAEAPDRDGAQPPAAPETEGEEGKDDGAHPDGRDGPVQSPIDGARTPTMARATQEEPAPRPVDLVRAPVVPGSAAMALGPRADAIDRAFYDAWSLPLRDEARSRRRNPGPNPVSVSLAALRDLNPDEYVVAEKTDGVRYALLLCRDDAGAPVAVMIDRACRKFEVSVRAAARFFDGTLLDGELAWERRIDVVPSASACARDAAPLALSDLVVDAGAAPPPPPPVAPCADAAGAGATPTETLVYWAFDAVCVAGVPYRDADYITRMEVVQRLLMPDATCLDDLVEASPEGNAHGLAFRPKPYVPARCVDAVWADDAPRLRHRTDGLVLTPLRDPICTGTHWRQFKWKHHHTFDLELRGQRRRHRPQPSPSPPGDRYMPDEWVWGLYYLEADWTVPTPQALARERGRASAGAAPATAATPPRAVYLNACEGITYRRSDAARDASERAAAAARRQARSSSSSSSAPSRSQHHRAPSSSTSAPGRDGAKNDDGDDECLVVFALAHDRALEELATRALSAQPGATAIRCIVECTGRFAEAPAGWRPPPGAPPGGARIMRCSIERLRTDKTDPNVRYTVRQTILNIDEGIHYMTVRSALCRPRR